MDQYIITQRKKVADVYGRDDISRALWDIISNKGTVCVYGISGVGKTFLINSILKNEKHVEITYDDIKSKETTNNFLCRLKSTKSHILIDDIDPDVSGWKEIANRVREGKRISEGALIFITKSIHKIDFCDCIQINPLPLDVCMNIAKKRFPNCETEHIEKSFKSANGNLRNFFDYLDFSDEKDIFLSPKEMVHDLLSKSDRHPSKYIGHTVEDHGYSWGIVHENYVNARNIDDKLAKISENMSIADVYDSKIYEGDWDLIPYFCNHGIISPAIDINQTLFRESIRPGSAWTKFNNYKSRSSKLKEIYNRTKLRIPELLHLRTLCNMDHDMAINMMVEYNIIPQDLDVINHLALSNKIKAKTVQLLKKRLRHEMEK